MQPEYRSSAVSAKVVDAGLRSYMIRVYNFMTAALFLSGLTAWLGYDAGTVRNASGEIVGLTAFGASLFGGGLFWIVALAPLAFIIVLSMRFDRWSYSTLQGVFWAFAATMGLSLSSIFLAYTQTSIVRVFLITGITFATMSLYGYTTKKDLTRMGSFMLMGLIGIIIASLVNIFFASSAVEFVISLLAVVIFTGLTAYDTQRIKALYHEAHSQDTLGKIALMGALSLYLDFINLFIHLLRLIGERR